jgi:hypothetical protein
VLHERAKILSLSRKKLFENPTLQENAQISINGPG